jgi:hypothetical protein
VLGPARKVACYCGKRLAGTLHDRICRPDSLEAEITLSASETAWRLLHTALHPIKAQTGMECLRRRWHLLVVVCADGLLAVRET